MFAAPISPRIRSGADRGPTEGGLKIRVRRRPSQCIRRFWRRLPGDLFQPGESIAIGTETDCHRISKLVASGLPFRIGGVSPKRVPSFCLRKLCTLPLVKANDRLWKKSLTKDLQEDSLELKSAQNQHNPGDQKNGSAEKR